MPRLDQRWDRPSARVQIVAVAELHQRAKRRDAKLQSADALIVRSAVQEDVSAIGLSTYNGGHIEFFSEIATMLREQGAEGIKVFGGGGGTITHADAEQMYKEGTDRIYFADTPLKQMMDEIDERYGGKRSHDVPKNASDEWRFCRALSAAEDGDGAAEWSGAKIGSTGKSIVIGPEQQPESVVIDLEPESSAQATVDPETSSPTPMRLFLSS